MFILKFFEKCEGRSNFLGIFNALENLEGGFFKKLNKSTFGSIIRPKLISRTNYNLQKILD